MSMRGYWFLLFTCLSAQIALAEPSLAEKNAAENAAIKKEWESWNTPFPPFRLIGNIHYVGASGISSFLITTPEGHILMDTGFETTVPRIRESVAKLGFKLSDIKIILNSHAHTDHAGGHALMQELTGARILMSEADAALLASGGTNDFTPYSKELMGYRPAKADRILCDGDKVTLGGTTLTCHLTPGHTKGCTTWTMDVVEDGETHHVVFFGSTSILSGVPLVNNAQYPGIADDLTASYKRLKSLPCDVFLTPHTGFFNLPEKAGRLARGEKPNPFVDANAFKKFLEPAEQKFLRQLKQETQNQSIDKALGN
ncbi:MAG: subclass B3 metallo-beta-lactamase [Verrucomicrobiota bacterium]